MKSLQLAMIASVLAIPLHGLAQTPPAPAASSGAIIMPPPTDSGMVKQPPRNVDPGALSKPPAGIDPEMIQKPEQTPDASSMPSRSTAPESHADPGGRGKPPHPDMHRNGKQMPEKDDCKGRGECKQYSDPGGK